MTLTEKWLLNNGYGLHIITLNKARYHLGIFRDSKIKAYLINNTRNQSIKLNVFYINVRLPSGFNRVIFNSG